jgi:hypothetical protein
MELIALNNSNIKADFCKEPHFCTFAPSDKRIGWK